MVNQIFKTPNYGSLPLEIYESKSRSIIFGMIVYIPLCYLLVKALSANYRDQSYVIGLFIGLIIFLIFFLLVIFLYPKIKICISEKGFIYSKGKKKVESNWSDVKNILFQIPLGYSASRNPVNFIIDTTSGKTDLISFNTLKFGNKKLDRKEFILLLENLSKKRVVVGDADIVKPNITLDEWEKINK